MINSRVVRPWRAHADGLRVAGFVYYYFLFSSSSSYVCVCVYVAVDLFSAPRRITRPVCSSRAGLERNACICRTCVVERIGTSMGRACGAVGDEQHRF